MSYLYDYHTSPFRTHCTTLDRRRSDAHDVISNWSKQLKAQIDESTQIQRQIVDKAYDKARNQLTQMEKEHRDTLWAFWNQNEYQQISLLLDECRKLQIDLVKIAHKTRGIQFIELEPVESFVTDRDQAKDPNNMVNNGGMANSDNGTGRTSLSGGTTSATSDSRQQRPSSSTHAGASNSSSSSQNNQMVASSTAIHINEDRICRRCYMIFPSSVSKQYIRDHADSHDR